MSREHVEVVRRIFEADARGEYEQALAYFAPDVEWDATHVADGQMLRGLAEVRGFIADWRAIWSDFQEDVEDIIDAGERVVIFFRDTGTGRAGGVRTEFRYTGVWDVRNGKVWRMKTFLDRAEALRYAGLAHEP
jgi:ketosteroid isomerase-like protein